MSTSTGKTVWVTGATSGLGLGLVKALAAGGNKIIATGRNPKRLNELRCLEGVSVLTADLTQDDAADSLKKALADMTDHLDQVILCAGVCEYFDIDEPDWGIFRRVLDVNFLGTTRCVQACLPLLQEGAHLVLVGSQASRAAFPRAQAYGASKAAVAYLAESLSIDLKSRGVDVTLVEPGFVDTPMTRNNDFSMPFLMSCDEAVTAILSQLERRPLYLRFPRPLSAVLRIGELAPRLWCKIIATRLSRT